MAPFRSYEHLLRLAALFAVGATLFLGLRWWLVPSDYGRLGPYRGMPREKILVNLDRYGNTSAASVPLALDEAVQRGLVRPGGRILLAGFGAGLAWGTALLRW